MSEGLNEIEKAKQWFIDQIRLSILDYEELNELIGRQEIGDEEIKASINRTIEEFNTMPPPISSYTFLTFPSKEILITGTIAKLLLSGSLLHFRNQLNYNAGGISVSTHDKGGAYISLADKLYNQFKTLAGELKTTINIQEMLLRRAGVGSSYGLLNWYQNSTNPAMMF